MIEIAIMIEGQNGLNWERWQRMALAVEELGFAGLYRSDHYSNAAPPDQDSLELWVSLTWLASHTRRIEFGPLVTPVSFRHPTMTARMASAVDDLSGGRLILGLGAGWNEHEHNQFGRPLLAVPERFERFEEGLEVITRLLRSDRPVSFRGKYYSLEDAILLPRPQRPGGPPILIGGNGARRTLSLAARFADEWNGFSLSPQQFEEHCRRLDELLIVQGRSPEAVKRSMMTGCVFGRSEQDVERKAAERTGGKKRPADLRQEGTVIGTAGQIREQINALDGAGVQRVMLQWLELDALEDLRLMAQGILAQ